MGQKYAAYDAQGAIVAYYDSVDSPPPEGVATIELADDEWRAAIQTTGYTVVAGVLTAPAPKTDADLLGEAQAIRAQVLYAACAAAITSGFTSPALGADYTYPSTLTDQTNQQSVAAAGGGALWCKDGTGAWAFTAHTQVQAQEVCASFVTWLNACQQQLVTLTAQVNASTSVAAAEAIEWSNPPK